jgi:outer membrane immunogenic protein
MRSLFLASTALAAVLSGQAVAADLPTAKGPALAPIAYAPSFTWSGFYVGANVGYAWGNSDAQYDYFYNQSYSCTVPDKAALVSQTPCRSPSEFINPNWVSPYGWPTGFKNDTSGFIGGVQAGYNYQFGLFVLGVEADIDWLSAKKTGSYFDAGNWSYAYGCGENETCRDYGTYEGALSGRFSLDWFGTLRARAGVAFDRALIYVTGGLAFGNVKASTSGSFNAYYDGTVCETCGVDVAAAAVPGQTPFYASTWYGSKSSTQVGWTIGAGAEYAITYNWTVKLEYLYYDLGDISYTVVGSYNDPIYTGLNGTNVNSFTARHDVTGNIVRAGVNYKF